MKLAIRNVAQKGESEKERLVIRVVDDTEIGDYIILRTGFVDGSVNVAVTHTFWFPNKSVKAGDLVVIYSKIGQAKDRPLDSGGTVHFYYWNATRTLWDNDSTAAVVAHAPDWIFKAAPDL